LIYVKLFSYVKFLFNSKFLAITCTAYRFFKYPACQSVRCWYWVDKLVLTAVISKFFVSGVTVQVYEIDLQEQNWAW